MNDPNLTDKEKEEIITKRRAKFDKERENNTIQALVLAEEYENNEVSADAKYKNKILFVDGVIEDISKDLFDKIFITLEGYELFGSVTCYVNDPEKVMTLSKGMRIVVRGRCDGTLLGVNMNDCEIIEVFESEDTLSILNRYIQEAEIQLDKSKVQKMIRDTYQKACEMV